MVGSIAFHENLSTILNHSKGKHRISNHSLSSSVSLNRPLQQPRFQSHSFLESNLECYDTGSLIFTIFSADPISRQRGVLFKFLFKGVLFPNIVNLLFHWTMEKQIHNKS